MEKNSVTTENSFDTLSMNLAIVGGGRACKFFLELLQNETFSHLDIKLLGVCDINPEAEGFCLAKKMGIYTTDNFQDLFKIKDLDGVMELTGDRNVLLGLIRARPKGVGVLEYNISRLLRGFFIRDQRLKSVEGQVLREKMAADFLMQQVNERISVLSPDFIIIKANEAYLRAVGKTKDEVIGAYCYEITHELNAPCSISQPALGCPLVETLKTGESSYVIHDHPISGGESTYCDIATYPLKNQNGEVVQVIEVSRDLTEKLSPIWERQADLLKDDIKKRLQEDRMISLGKLAASCVHEINNPIQGLLTFSHLMQNILEDGTPGIDELKKFQSHLSIMSSELERCGNIVSGLLSFSRQPEMGHKNIDLNEVLEQVITVTRHKTELQDIGLNVRLHPAPLIVNGHINQLQQCFLNLVFNAIEAMPKGGKLSVLSNPDKAGKNALVEIQDTGYGISKENLNHIFDPFFTTKTEGEGTGMGLSIVYGIVKNYGGNIKVDSRGKGSSFVLNFPIP